MDRKGRDLSFDYTKYFHSEYLIISHNNPEKEILLIIPFTDENLKLRKGK